MHTGSLGEEQDCEEQWTLVSLSCSRGLPVRPEGGTQAIVPLPAGESFTSVLNTVAVLANQRDSASIEHPLFNLLPKYLLPKYLLPTLHPKSTTPPTTAVRWAEVARVLELPPGLIWPHLQQPGTPRISHLSPTTFAGLQTDPRFAMFVEDSVLRPLEAREMETRHLGTCLFEECQTVVKYCQFPADSPGNVSVTNEDYNCLEAEQFLNDVIIDFYLKYIQNETFASLDGMMARTHIFTTYFYKRLTTRPPNSKTKAHPVEDNPNLSAAEKRYERVKKWTKNVNIFEKDFIVVPINEHAHWFVCVICFPGQLGAVRADDGRWGQLVTST